MIAHRESVEEIIARAEQFARPVIGGGPLFTTGHEAYSDRVHAVLGDTHPGIGCRHGVRATTGRLSVHRMVAKAL